MITYDDFRKLEIKIGRVVSAGGEWGYASKPKDTYIVYWRLNA